MRERSRVKEGRKGITKVRMLRIEGGRENGGGMEGGGRLWKGRRGRDGGKVGWVEDCIGEEGEQERKGGW